MNLKNEKVLVTGGMGFIGSHIVRALVMEGATVRIYDNFSTGLIDNIADVKTNVEIIRGDILDSKHLSKAIKGSTIVSHQAAQLEITQAIKDPTEDLTTNTIGTINVLNACVDHHVKKLVFASSACVYGQKNDTPSKETDATNPNWAYGVGKLAAEKYLRIYSDLYGLSTVALRYGIVYGTSEWYGRVMTIFLKRAVSGQPLIVFGQGKQKRDFTHVSDVVRANLFVMKENIHCDVFNVSTGIGTTIAELARLIERLAPKKPEIIFDKNVAPGEKSTYINRMRLPSELTNMILSNKKLKALGWKPQVALRDGLARQLEWVAKHPSRWKKMSY